MIPMELPKATSRRAGGGGSNSSSTSHAPAPTTPHDTLEVRIDVGMETSKIAQPYPKHRMEKVPLIMRKDKKTKGYFDPMVISVGPYHHGKEELQMAEKIKPVIAQLFISNSGRDMAEFRQKVFEIVDDARSCYIEGSTDKYSDEEFAEMMLLDGLFVSAFIESITPFYEGPRMDQNEFKKHFGEHALHLLVTDIHNLLENQLPFQVLELLTSLKYHRNQLITMMDGIREMVKSMQSRRPDMEKFTRLFDNTRRVSKTMQPRHCLDYLWLRANEFRQSNATPRHSVKQLFVLDFYHSFRSITELKAKGIHARPSSSIPTRDFRFKSFFFFGVLEVPPLTLDPEYVIYVSNQIAYESTPNNPNNQPTMALINFMKSLINSAADVKELRSNNILFSTYSSDEEVVKIFNSIPTFRVVDFIYEDVKERIQMHYNSKGKTWIAELIHTYFNSPWTFIALVASTLVTYFTVFPRSSN